MYNSAPKPIAFEVTIKEAEKGSPFKPIENKKPLSETKIKEKLESAEERRLSLKSQKQEQAAAELKKVQEKALKVQEEAENKRKRMEEELAADLEAKELNRKQFLELKKKKIQTRLANHALKFEEMNQLLESARKQLSERITSEHELAEDRRNKQLGGLLDRIKEHDSKISEAKRNLEEANTAYAGQIEEKHMDKFENGLKNRQDQINQLIERLKEHAIHVENVRKNKKTAIDGQEDN